MRPIALCILALLSAGPLAAQEPQVYGLTLEPIPELPVGKVAMVQGTAEPSEQRFLVESLSILQPVAVSVLARNPDHDLRLRLSKFGFDETLREGSTGGTGLVTFKIRTEGDLRISVSSDQTQLPYQLVVWAGDEVQPSMPPVVVPMPKSAAHPGPGSLPLPRLVLFGAIAGGLALGVGTSVAILILRKGRT